MEIAISFVSRSRWQLARGTDLGFGLYREEINMKEFDCDGRRHKAGVYKTRLYSREGMVFRRYAEFLN